MIDSLKSNSTHDYKTEKLCSKLTISFLNSLKCEKFGRFYFSADSGNGSEVPKKEEAKIIFINQTTSKHDCQLIHPSRKN